MSEWRLANRFGSVRPATAAESAGAFFHAGRVNDALRLMLPGTNPLLIACPESGVWLVNEAGGPAIPLSASSLDVQFNCLAAGVYGPTHVYAGGMTLVESDVTAAVPLFTWRHIDLLLIDDHGVETPLKSGTINRIVVCSQLRRLVMACDLGVFWAPIPASPGGPYLFKSARVVDAGSGALLNVKRFSSVALSLSENIVAGAWGTDKLQQWGIFFGTWISLSGTTDLEFQRAAIRGAFDQTQMFRTEIASCASNRSVLFAVAGGGGGLIRSGDAPDGFGNLKWKNSNTPERILAVLRSEDFGFSWDLLSTSMSLAQLAGTTADGITLCIGVSPFDPKLVAVGAVKSLCSRDYGYSWTLLDPDVQVGLHDDIHALVFDPADTARSKLFICGDGGIASTNDFGRNIDTSCNRQLPNFEFRRFAASAHDSGVIAGSLQDNGNAYASLYPTLDPWRAPIGGDGAEVALLTTSSLVGVPNPLHEGETTIPPSGFSWDEVTRRFTFWGDIPLDGAPGGLMAKTDDFPSIYNRIQSVADPVFTNTDGEKLVGIAVESETLYGLFATSGGPVPLHWTPLATIPHLPSHNADGTEESYFGTACVSRTGQKIFAGTNNGHIFGFDAPTFGPAVDLGVVSSDAQVLGIVESPDGTIFVNVGDSVHRLWSVHRLVVGGTWKKILPATPAEEDSFTALCIDPTTSAIFVGGARSLRESTDGGNTWFPTQSGLPLVINCRDLRFATEVSGANFLYAATFGWSAFRRLLNADDTQNTVTINGHMDIVDRVALGTDDWAHPTISNTFVLGTFHPIDETEYVEDDGDEVRVRLKIHLEWHLDFSVFVRFDAWLIDKEEDGGEIDAENHGSFSVPFLTSATETIDLASDDVWPDRAHIEFTVKNP